jgi:tetratricopeptide (TPR) repeat protein
MGMTEEVRDRYSRAENFIREGKELFAVQIYKQMLDERLETRATMLRLAHLYEQMKLYDKTSELIENFLSEGHDDEVAFLYGQFLMRIKNFRKAIEIFRNVSADAYPDVYYFRGIANYEIGEFKAASESLAKYLESGEKRNREKALFASVNVALKSKDYDTALQHLDLLDKISGLDRTVIFSLYAKTYFAKGLFYYAKDYILKTLKRDSASEEMLLLAAKVHFNLGEYSDAAKYLRQLIEGGVKSAQIYALAGFSAIAKNDFEEAQKYLMKALEINPYDKNVILLKTKLTDLQGV